MLVVGLAGVAWDLRRQAVATGVNTIRCFGTHGLAATGVGMRRVGMRRVVVLIGQLAPQSSGTRHNFLRNLIRGRGHAGILTTIC